MFVNNAVKQQKGADFSGQMCWTKMENAFYENTSRNNGCILNCKLSMMFTPLKA